MVLMFGENQPGLRLTGVLTAQARGLGLTTTVHGKHEIRGVYM